MLRTEIVFRLRPSHWHRLARTETRYRLNKDLNWCRNQAQLSKKRNLSDKPQIKLSSHAAKRVRYSTLDEKYATTNEESEKSDTCPFSSEILHELGLQNLGKLDNETDDDVIPVRDENSSESKRMQYFFEEKYSNSVDVFCNYIQACLHANLFTHVLNILEFRINSVKKLDNQVSPSISATEIKVYDLILYRLSTISPMTQISSNFAGMNASPLIVIQKIFEELNSLNLRPSPFSYAAMLEALDKCENSNVKIALCLQKMEDDGYTMNDVVKSCVPGSKSIRHVINAISQVASYNEYEPKISNGNSYQEQTPCSNLVKEFYETTKYEPGSLKLTSLCKVSLDKKYNEQIAREKSRLLVVQNILASNSTSKEVMKKKKHLEETIKEWRTVLLKEFKDTKARLRSMHANWTSDAAGNFTTSRGGKLYPFFCLLPEDEYVEIMIRQLLSGGDSTVSVNFNMGTQVYSMFALKRMKDTGIMSTLKKVYTDYRKIYFNDKLQSSVLPRHLWLQLEDKHGLTNLEEKIVAWDQYWTLSVGTKLSEIMNCALFTPYPPTPTGNFSNKVPAMYNCYVLNQKKRYGMTIPHPLFRVLLKDVIDKLIFESTDAPMVVPPRPWCNGTKGGFLLDQVASMRFSSVGDHFEARDFPQSPISHQVFDALNILGSVAWRVNQPILDLQIKYFRNKGNKELSIAQPPSESDPMPDMSNVHRHTAKFEKMRKRAREIQKHREELYALYMEALYKFSIANEYRNDIVWFPHNIDFRGRSYPVQKHLNYMGSDVYRALFSFAEGRPLCKKGLDWLKIHCINLTEFKKHSPLRERLAYADEVIDQIISSADNPEAEDAWWKKADKPWQTLAACIEIAAAVRSPDPTKFISTLPIHQDGSCNGLQHYAALGRDVLGAHQVNLSPSEYQQDVYVGVANKAEELRKADAINGIEIARKLEGFVRRKVVKQTVMTTVYGVTRYGGKHQIMRQLGYLEGQFPKEDCNRGADYLVGRVFDSITEMFSGAKSIQTWLTNLAQVVSRMGHAVDWVTPLDLLVSQPYFKSRSKYIRSPLQRISVNESLPDTPDKVRQVNGFPPNFIHSLDSTHMMLTALFCYQHGITFSSVHDCFWTHASSVDEMGRICREQFVALHNQRILHDLACHLRKHLPKSYNREDLTPLQERLHYLVNNVPQQGNFDLNEVLESTFFFS